MWYLLQIHEIQLNKSYKEYSFRKLNMFQFIMK